MSFDMFFTRVLRLPRCRLICFYKDFEASRCRLVFYKGFEAPRVGGFAAVLRLEGTDF